MPMMPVSEGRPIRSWEATLGQGRASTPTATEGPAPLPQDGSGEAVKLGHLCDPQETQCQRLSSCKTRSSVDSFIYPVPLVN